MKKCKNCSARVEDNIKVCGNCGGTQFVKLVPKKKPENTEVNTSSKAKKPNRNNTNNSAVKETKEEYSKPVITQAPAPKLSRKEKKVLERQLMQEMVKARNEGRNFDETKWRLEHGLLNTQQKNKALNDGPHTNVEYGSTSVVEWIIRLVLLMIPILNIVIIVKNMNSYKNSETDKNFYKAFGIYYLAAFILSIIIAMIL